MASSSSNPSSTSPSSSTTSTPSAARVLSETENLRLATRAAAPAGSAALGVAPDAIAPASVPNIAPTATTSATAPSVATGAIASATACGVAPSAIAPASASTTAPNFAPSATAPGFALGTIESTSALNVAPVATVPGVSRSIPLPPPRYDTSWGGSKRVPPPTNFSPAHWRGGEARAPNSAGVSRTQNIFRMPSPEWGWATAADPTSTFAKVMRSTDEGSSASSSSASPWSAHFTASSTVASTPTDTRPASTASSTTTPSRDSTLVPNASGSALAAEMSAHTAPGLDVSTSSAPVVTKISDLALTSASSSAPKIVSASLEPGAPATTPSSAIGAMTSTPGAAPTASATTSSSGAAPSILFGGNDMPAVAYPDPLRAWREEVQPRPFVVQLCWQCNLEPATIEGSPCGHLILCARCYNKRLVCPCCGVPVTWRW